MPVWSVLLVGYLLTRVWGWAVLVAVGRNQGPSPWGEGPLGYLEMLGMWDSGWYEQIAHHGYPEQLPVDAEGRVRQNPWAFYPLFPLSARGLMAVTGWGYPAAGGLLALLCGAVLTLGLYLLFRQAPAAARGDHHPVSVLKPLVLPVREADQRALWAAALVLLTPVSVILQIPYAEVLGATLLTWFFVLLLAQRVGAAALLLVLVCLSRPVGVPLAAALGLWWCWTVIQRRHEGWATALLTGKRWLMLALLGCAAALSWPAIAWAYTGRIDAYTATETAWRGADLAPLLPWWTQAQHYLGPAGPLILLILLVLFAGAMISAPVLRTLPRLMRLWCWSYLVYLLIFLFPQSSTFRLLLPLFPLALPMAEVSESRAYRVLLLIGAALGQLIWVGWLWHWKELPGGGDYPP